MYINNYSISLINFGTKFQRKFDNLVTNILIGKLDYFLEIMVE